MIVEPELLFDLGDRLRDLGHRGIERQDLFEYLRINVPNQRDDVLTPDLHATIYTTGPMEPFGTFPGMFSPNRRDECRLARLATMDLAPKCRFSTPRTRKDEFALRSSFLSEELQRLPGVACSVHRAPSPVAAVDLQEDLAFDARLPLKLRHHSLSHFTPVEVARYAAELLASVGDPLVLDVGAGAGKFCLVAAAHCPNATFVGVELRGELVDVATRLAAEWRLPNARFVHCDAFDLDWSRYDAFYFYNPFGEHLFESTIGRSFWLDDTIELHRDHFNRYVAMTHERLATAREGTRVITYHGMGADLPPSYDCMRVEQIGSDSVELWEQSRSTKTLPYRRVPEG